MWSGPALRPPAPPSSMSIVRTCLANSLTYAIDTSPTIAPIITISYGGCESGFGASFVSTVQSTSPDGECQGHHCDELVRRRRRHRLRHLRHCLGGPQRRLPRQLSLRHVGRRHACSAAMSTMRRPTGTAATRANNSSAKSYIPEQPWNETTASGGLDAGGAGGGGASGFFSKPAWQVGPGVPNDSSRDVPDVSLNAAAMHDGYVVCSQGSCTNGFLSSTARPMSSAEHRSLRRLWPAFSHWSNSSSATGALGNIGPILYGLANGPNPTSIFHDITRGNNSVPARRELPTVPVEDPSAIAPRSPGYNQATGLGSLDVNMLVTNWAGATPTGTGSTHRRRHYHHDASPPPVSSVRSTPPRSR